MRFTTIHGWMLGITAMLGAVLGACFEPSSPTSNPCGAGGYCPEDLVCHPQRNICVRPIDGPDAGPAIDASPGPDNADLQSFELSVPGLAPAFAGDTTEYELAVSELVRSVHVIARPQHPNAIVTVAGVTTPAGQPSAPIPVPPAPTTVAITVTAPAGNQKTYLVELRPGGSMAQHIYAKAHNAGEGDVFGWRVAIDGDTLAVAASYETSCATGVHPTGQEGDNGCVNSGAVYVFRRRGSTWEPEAYLKPFNTNGEDEFGVSLALDGDTLAVGAFHEDSGVPGDGQNNALSNSGAAYVFRRVDGAWQQDAYLKANSPQKDQEFGWSVAVAGDLVAVGARLEDSGDTTDSGAVYLFRRNVSRWIPEARLEAPALERANEDFFGYSVTAEGDVVAVGACGHGCPPAGRTIPIRQSPGAVHVFRRSGAAWAHEAALAPQSPDPADAFGRAVAMAGDLLIIGAPSEDSKSRGIDQDQDDDSVSGSGAAYVFRKSGPSWTQEAYLKATNTGPTHRFGAGVAIAGELVAVGALGESSCATGIDEDPDEGCANSGAVYLYRHNGTAWSTLAYVKASNTAGIDEFGTSVALSDDALVVGAPYEDRAGTRIEYGPDGGRSEGARPDSGAVYLFH